MIRLLLLLLLGAIALPVPANAHTTSQSFSSWQYTDETVAAVFVVDSRRVTQLAQLYDAMDLTALLAMHLSESITVRQGERPCAATAPEPVRSEAGFIRLRLAFRCGEPVEASPAIVTIAAFQAVSATHFHIARVMQGDAQSSREILLTEARPAFELAGTESVSEFSGFFYLGFVHVLSGLDHLAFLAALALLCRSPRRILLAVTGFTLGHSLTLALVSLNILSPDERLIEIMIAFTIAITALEAGLPAQRRRAFRLFAAATLAIAFLPGMSGNVSFLFAAGLAGFALASGQLPAQTAGRLVPLISVAFGLAHGAGFAGGLGHLALPADEILLPLLGFNLGVEAGQIGALAVFYLTVISVRRIWPASRTLQPALPAAILFAAGCYWFAVRLWT